MLVNQSTSLSTFKLSHCHPSSLFLVSRLSARQTVVCLAQVMRETQLLFHYYHLFPQVFIYLVS